MSGCRKIISGKLETHYERRCLGSFQNTLRLGTNTYPKDGLIITRSVSEKMVNILKIYEVLVLCAPTYRYYDKTLTGRRHNVKTLWRAPGSRYLHYLRSHTNGAFLSIFLKPCNYVRSECIFIIYKFEFNWKSSFVFINKFHELFAPPSYMAKNLYNLPQNPKSYHLKT